MKRTACLFLTILLFLSVFTAWASNAPTSQFGFKGWPYRQNNPSCALNCDACRYTQSCTSCSDCQDLLATAIPNVSATPQPMKPPAVQPTFEPSTTPAAPPTVRPTPRPTENPVSTPAASTGDYTTLSVAAQEQKLLNLLNRDRIANGLPALTLDSELSRIARIKSQDMNDHHYFAHTSPTYGNAAAMLTHFGYAYKGVGENIAHHATVEKTQAAFMSSDGHRRNILGSQWTKVGIGICIDVNGFIYATQIFVR